MKISYKVILALVLWCALLPLWTTLARADGPTVAEQRAIEKVIRAQLTAFLTDNGPAAYTHASPMIQRMFPNEQVFMAMVKQGYPQIYRSQQAIFSDPVVKQGVIFQPVTIVGRDGRVIQANYQMLRGQKGRWRINGVYAQPAPGAGS